MTWSFHVHSNTAFVPAVSTMVIVTILESWWACFCCPATRDTPSQLTHCFYPVLKPYNCVVLAVYNSKSVQLPYGFYTGHLDGGWVHVYTVFPRPAWIVTCTKRTQGVITQMYVYLRRKCTNTGALEESWRVSGYCVKCMGKLIFRSTFYQPGNECSCQT